MLAQHTDNEDRLLQFFQATIHSSKVIHVAKRNGALVPHAI